MKYLPEAELDSAGLMTEGGADKTAPGGGNGGLDRGMLMSPGGGCLGGSGTMGRGPRGRIPRTPGGNPGGGRGGIPRGGIPKKIDTGKIMQLSNSRRRAFARNVEILLIIFQVLLSRKWCIFSRVILKYSKFANFTGLYFSCFTTFRNQTLQFY